MPLTALVLAAGASKRLGRPKQLVMWDGEPLVLRAARLAQSVAPALVVIPPDDAIRDALRGFDIIINDQRDEGMASSIRAGVAGTNGDVLITLCDQPRVTAEHLRALVEARSPIAATGYAGTVGVPAYFAAKFRNELLALRGDVGAKRLFEAHRDELAIVPFEAASLDVDTL